VLGAGAAVALTGSWWPDALVGSLIAILYLTSSASAIVTGSVELRQAGART
jgi:hypothetical protein